MYTLPSFIQNPHEATKWFVENGGWEDIYDVQKRMCQMHPPYLHEDEADEDLCAVCGEPFTDDNPCIYTGTTSELRVEKGVCLECSEEDDYVPCSVCCGAEMPMWPDVDICPECKEHTDVEEDEENEDDPRIEER